MSAGRAVWKPLDRVVSRAWATFDSKAFLHQYTQYGFGEDEFVESFIRTEQICKSYKELGS